ncbi:MAG: sodium ion-translocating decarboxylase subunit beta [Lachnospiraceae bacterium]|nr:sodium ion-translocating decarboxylase subunit beta [Lachnospiraceae bacterium]
MDYIMDTLAGLAKASGFASLYWGNWVMILVALFFLYLAIAKGYEPLLLVPIAFGMLLVNMYPQIAAEPSITYEYYSDSNSVNEDKYLTVNVTKSGEYKVMYKDPADKDGDLKELDIVEAYYNSATHEYIKIEDNPIDVIDAGYIKCVFAFKDSAKVSQFKESGKGILQSESEIAAAVLGTDLSTYDNLKNSIVAPESKFTKTTKTNGGIFHYFFILDEWSILPCLIFMGVGAMTDFGPLIANPRSFLLGAAAQLGIFMAYLGAMALGFTDAQAAAVSIIGGADGPTSIFLAGKLGQTKLLGAIAVAAYSYMSLVPIIQPPIMKLLTTEKERKIKMKQLRPVTKLEKILFPIIVTIIVVLMLPDTAPLIGCLMLGNLFRESGVVRQLQETASNAMMYIVVILLGTSVGATTSAEAFLQLTTIKIVALGLIAFAFGTAGGVLLGKLMCKLTHGEINPLIGSAGVSAVPMAARVSQKVGAEEDPSNFLLMHAMGPNVAGVIGTAVAAGVFMAIFGV